MQEGDRVIMPEHERITPMADWPVQGSEYECEGTIVNVDGSGMFGELVDVEWDSGHHLYGIVPKHLKVIEKGAYYTQKKELKL